MSTRTAQSVVLPGLPIPNDLLPIPSDPNRSLKLGNGLVHTPPSSISASTSGILHTDSKKHAVWVESNSSRYVPIPGDLVIATVLRSAAEQFFLQITPHSPNAVLGHLSFENVSKKTRPQLNTGATVYARVLSADRHLDTELACVNPSTGKAEGMGELKGGMVFDISSTMARRLLLKKVKEHGGIAILDLLAEKINFELAVGVNGRLWVDGSSVKETLAVGRAIRETDERNLDFDAQKKFAGKLLREIGKG